MQFDMCDALISLVSICASVNLQINYTTIAGKFVKGAKLDQEGSPLAKFAGAGYQQVRWGEAGARKLASLCDSRT